MTEWVEYSDYISTKSNINLPKMNVSDTPIASTKFLFGDYLPLLKFEPVFLSRSVHSYRITQWLLAVLSHLRHPLLPADAAQDSDTFWPAGATQAP